MNRSHFTHLALLIGSVVFLFAATWDSDAQDRMLTTFSGRAVDEAGNPVTGLTIAIFPVEDGNGAWFPVHDDQHDWPMDPPAFQSETDSEGHFAITDAIAGPVLLTLLPYYKPEAVILKVQIGGMFLYPNGEPWGRGVVFSMDRGEYIENVDVTVQHFLELRGKVLKMGGNSLRNARIHLKVEQLGLGERYEDSGSMSWGTETDDEGDFVQHISRYMSGPAFYIMSVTYQGKRANLDPIVVKPEDLTHEPVFTFENLLMPDLPEDAPRRFRASASASADGGLDAQGVWVVNPANGHAYKKIPFSSTEDAISQASEDSAYIVAINDGAEQKWLEQVFLPMWTLIGLSDTEQEGEWRWQSGEPVTYTNWARYEPEDADNGDEDYVILMAGKWMDIGLEDIRWRFVRGVLLEKESSLIEK